MNDIFLYTCNICKSKQKYLICIDGINKYFKKSSNSNLKENIKK